MEAVIHSSGIPSSIRIWLVTVIFSRDKYSAASFFTSAQWMTSNAYSDRRSRQSANPPVVFLKSRIHLSASWTVLTENRNFSSRVKAVLLCRLLQGISGASCRMPTRRHSTAGTNIPLVYRFRQSVYAEEHILSACLRHPYLRYRRLANVEESTQGLPYSRI